jgi:aminopeptidase N
MRLLSRLSLLLVGSISSLGVAAAAESLPGRLPTGVVPLHYEISVAPDARALTFSGRAVIDVDVQTPTDTITLNALDLDIASARLDDVREAVVMLDPQAQVATLQFQNPVAAGPHHLTFDYRGKIATSPAGLFAVDYDTATGMRRMLATQFEVGEARRFAPMWDEPSAKATFALEVLIPKGDSAYSNMPVATTSVEGGKRRVRFATTPRMSSYLLYLSVGELDRISQSVAGVDVGVVTRKGASSSGRFALAAAVEILPWYNEYFGTPYPLPKLDLIAVPSSSPSYAAMENWGAILYFEPYLLVDPRLSSQSDRQNVFSVVAHEVAHMWFGDLVTMEWWDDLWLNEGYANWMADKVEGALHPERKPLLQVVNGSWQRALRLDASPATHPVVQRIDSVDAANQAFDAIAYDKGSAVVRMVEDTLGESGFREGIRRYMKQYAYGNATTDQLWAELAAATGRPVTEIAHDLTLQPGVPLVSVATTPCAEGHASVTLSQGRFETGAKAAQRLTWRIPVRLKSLRTGATKDVLLGKDGAPSTTMIDGCGPVVINSGQAGYFRTRYPDADLAVLAAEFSKAAEIDRLGLLNDTWARGEAGELPVTSYLELARAVTSDSDPVILIQLADTLTRIDKLFDGSAEQRAWRTFARERLQPAFVRVGWVPVRGETETAAVLRERLILALGRFDDPAVLAEARTRFARSRTSLAALPAAIREAAISVVARHADRVTWNELLTRAKAATEPIEKQRLFEALGLALDPALVSRALALSLSGAVPTAFASDVIDSASAEHPKLAFDFAVAHEKQVLDLVDVTSRWLFIPALAQTSAEPAMVEQVRGYAQRSIPSDARQTAERVVADIEFRAAVRARQLPALEAWVEQTVAEIQSR